MGKVSDVMQEERRRDRRREVLIGASINSVPVKVVDLSIAGVRGAIEILSTSGHQFQEGVRMVMKLDDAPAESEIFEIEIVHTTDSDGMFGARFVDLTDSQYRLLEQAVLGRFGK